MSSASTAVLVKSRAKFGKRLTDKDYDDLLSCRSMGDIVTYLKSNTHYNVSLEGIHEAAVHRGNLEALLKRSMYDDFANLCSFERSVGEHYFEYLLLKSEIDQLLLFFRYFTAGTPQSFPFALPDFFKHSSKLNVAELTHAKSFNEIMNILKPTRFYKVLIPFKPRSENDPPDFTLMESALDRYLYDQTKKLCKKYFSGNTQKELMTIFGAQAELDNIRRIYRSKKYYDTTADELKALMNEQRLYLTKRALNDLLEAKDEKDVISLLKKTRYRLSLEKYEYLYIDDFARRFIFGYCRKKMHFSKEPAVVMASAINLSETEIYNITNIIEGKRYGVERDVIKAMLILDEQG